MRQAATATAVSAEQRSTRSTKILLTVAGLMLVGLIYSVVARDPDVSCPNELIGAWVTSAKGYEEGMLVFSKTGVAFSVGIEHLDAQAVRRLDATPDGPRTLYTVVYGDSRKDEQTLSFYYHTKDQTITFKNQAHLVWTRKAVQS
ncbi:MAG: hypothetical protein OEU68_17425 [Nitrospira sp.]|nr:hypothetical protein [Nitrospira sp.]MDH4355248.1 hypothetical protein [Nitrospira sp.]MDH5319128.1 hypothetical protein [Nitrospira sp.]